MNIALLLIAGIAIGFIGTDAIYRYIIIPRYRVAMEELARSLHLKGYNRGLKDAYVQKAKEETLRQLEDRAVNYGEDK